MINIIKDIDLFDHVNDYDVTLVGTNINCLLTQGLQRKIMLNYPYVQEMNMKTKYGDISKLGTLLECKSDIEPNFTLLFICKGNYRPDINKEYLSYDSLEKCLSIVDKLYKGKNVAAPMLGTSRFDGNGDKDKVLEIFQRTIKNVNLTIYDYFQKSREEELKEIRKKEIEVKNTDYQKYREMVRERKEKADIRRKKNGHAAY